MNMRKLFVGEGGQRVSVVARKQKCSRQKSFLTVANCGWWGIWCEMICNAKFNLTVKIHGPYSTSYQVVHPRIYHHPNLKKYNEVFKIGIKDQIVNSTTTIGRNTETHG